MNVKHEGFLSISDEGRAMLEGMPKEIAISVMVSLAINMIRMKSGELEAKDMTNDPIKLIGEVAAMIALHDIVERIEKAGTEAIDKAKVH